jgi:hypothetical protein
VLPGFSSGVRGGGRGARKYAYKLMFKPFKTVFTEEGILLGCKVMYFLRSPTFQRNISPITSG